MIAEALLAAITDAVIGYAFERGADGLGERVREKLGMSPTKKASTQRWDKHSSG